MVETYLRCFVNGQPKHWVRWLHWAEFCYNTSPHLSIKMTPFQALYGRVPPHVGSYGSPTNSRGFFGLTITRKACDVGRVTI